MTKSDMRALRDDEEDEHDTTPPEAEPEAPVRDAHGRKLHPVLARIAKRGRTTAFTQSAKIDGVEYTLRTPNGDDQDWILDNVPAVASPVAYMVAQMKPRIARTLESIDGTPIEVLFPFPPEMRQAQRESLATSPKRLKAWRASRVLEWMNGEDFDSSLIYEIQAEIIEPMDKRQAEIIDERRGLSKGTPPQS